MVHKNEITHIPVLLKESLEYLNVMGDGVYVDCTGGGGGHSSAILERLTTGRLIVLDRDPEACERLKQKFKGIKNVEVINENFSNIENILAERGLKANGIIADFGLSTYQLFSIGRGFSFRNDDLLDMRMDKKSEISAFDVVNTFLTVSLSDVFTNLGFNRYPPFAIAA